MADRATDLVQVTHRRAKYYTLTECGRKQLKAETEAWGKQIAAIARIMEAS